LSARRPFVIALALAGLVAGCTIGTSAPPSSPSPTGQTPPRTGQTTGAGQPVDSRQAERLQRLMVPLIRAMNSPRPLNKVRVGIIDEAQINAANAGGGEFYVTRGLLEKANDEQLTAILAHEVAHDDLGHVAKAQVLGTGLGIGAIILDQIVPGAGSVASIGGQLIARGYSRREEYQADQHGVEILKRAGHPGDWMVNTLTWLLQTSGGSSGGFFSTHPATGDRIEALRNLK
jgi:predicted Zn-dependent protease